MLLAPDDPGLQPWAEGLLGPADRDRAAKKRHPVGRRRTVISRALLRLLAASILGTEAERVWTGTSRYGAPLAGRRAADDSLRGSPLAVSLTHTKGAVIAAASPDAARLGVDVERLDRRVRAEALARRYFAPDEAASLLALPQASRSESFLRAWTLKEAWGKATGMGVSRALPLLSFVPDELARSTGAIEPREGRIATESVRRFPGRWRFWTATVGIHSIGLAAVGSGALGAPSLPGFPTSAMIRRVDRVGSDPVSIFRMDTPPH